MKQSLAHIALIVGIHEAIAFFFCLRLGFRLALKTGRKKTKRWVWSRHRVGGRGQFDPSGARLKP